jgi:hypothetical protein
MLNSVPEYPKTGLLDRQVTHSAAIFHCFFCQVGYYFK